MQPATPVGLVGLGLLGAALAERLIAAGYAVSGFDIDGAKLDSFARNGGRVAPLAELAQYCETLVLAVYDGQQVENILEALKSLPAPGRQRSLICTTTCEPACIERAASRAAGAGIDLVEAPISGTSAELSAGDATALVAGEPAIVDRLTPLLVALCPRIVRIGRIGDASRMKLAINLVLQSNRAALAEGIAFVEAMGLNGSAFLDAARASAAYSKVMDTKGEKMLQSDFRPQSRIAQTLKDADLILGEARKLGLTLPMTATQAQLLRDTIALKGEDCDSAAVVDAIRQGPATERTKT